MFERFTEKGVKSIMIGQEEARRSGRDFVSCEDILIGIILENTSVASTVLDSLEINIYQIRREVERLVGKKNLAGPTRDIPFAPNTRVMLERSMKIAGDFGQSYVAPEHMLLGIIAKPMLYITFELFQALKVNIPDLTKNLISAMGADIEMMPSYNDGEFSPSPTADAHATFDNDNQDGTDFYRNNQNNESNNEVVSLESIKEYVINLSTLASQGNLDPVIGRANEIARVINILLRRKKNNAILIGEPGVGKTSVAEGLALKIMNSDVPDLLINKEIISLDISLLLAGTKFRGEFEERLKNVLQLIKKSKKIILVIDEVHTLIGAGAAEGGVDAANILKPILTRGELQCIGATTNEEYRNCIRLVFRFDPTEKFTYDGKLQSFDSLDEQTQDELLFDSKRVHASMDTLYEITTTSSFFRELYLNAAGRMFSTDPKIGQAVVCAYDTFDLYHACVWYYLFGGYTSLTSCAEYSKLKTYFNI